MDLVTDYARRRQDENITISNQDVRGVMGRLGLSDEKPLRKVGYLSGGETTRVVSVHHLECPRMCGIRKLGIVFVVETCANCIHFFFAMLNLQFSSCSLSQQSPLPWIWRRCKQLLIWCQSIIITVEDGSIAIAGYMKHLTQVLVLFAFVITFKI